MDLSWRYQTLIMIPEARYLVNLLPIVLGNWLPPGPFLGTNAVLTPNICLTILL